MTAEAILYGVGAQKAGTTWLHGWLAAHPACHARPLKEVHYFNLSGAEAFGRRAASRRRLRARAAARLAEGRGGEAGKPDPAGQIAAIDDWLATFEGGAATDGDYLAYLGRGANEAAVRVDVTPAYCGLPEAAFERMRGLARRARFLFILRDPVDRLWSTVQMRERRVGEPTDPAALFARKIERIEGGEASPRSDYRATLTRLARATAPEERLTLFFEELFSQSALDRIADFVGVPRRPGRFVRADRRPRAAAPASLERRAERALRKQYEFVAEFFGGALPARWERRMEFAA